LSGKGELVATGDGLRNDVVFSYTGGEEGFASAGNEG